MKKNRKRNNSIAIALMICIAVVIILSLIGGSNQSGTASQLGSIVINEVMAANQQAVIDDYGEYSDWIELYNTSTEPVSINGWALSDSKLEPAKWSLPDITLQPGEYLLIFCSGKDVHDTTSGHLHTNFKLSAQGETVVLSNNIGAIVDVVEFSFMASNTSLGRQVDDLSTLTEFTKPTPGYENSDAGYAQYVASIDTEEDSPLLISEVMASNTTTLRDDYGNYSDWLEIYNAGDTAVNLLNYGLSDDVNDLLQWRFPDVTLQPGEYLVVFCSGAGVAKDPESTEYLHTSFKISSYQETLFLVSKTGKVIDSVEVSALAKDSAYARNQETGEWAVTLQPTPGYPNTEEGYQQFMTAHPLAQGPVIISEVMTYNNKYAKTKDGAYYDWVELHNISGESVNLIGWGLTDNTGNPGKWRFPDVTLAPGERIVVLCSGLNKTDTSSGYMQTSFRLAIDGEIVALFNAQDELVDRLNVVEVPANMSYGRMLNQTGLFYFENPTPGTENKNGAVARAQQPALSLAGGTYRGEQTVTITAQEGATIMYTTDGTIPTLSNGKTYSQPITVTDTTPIRARAFVDGYISSVTSTATYFIDSPHSLPIVSLVTDPDNLFDKDYGIYVLGNGTDDPNRNYPGANWWNDWEREVHFEYIDESGDLGLSVDGGIKIFGAYSRMRDQKGFSIWARKQYGTDMLEYPFFDTRPYTEYKSIVLRAGANDCQMAKIRDIVMTDLVREYTTLDVAAYKQCVVYINGEYWGVYNIREKINKNMLAQHHNLENAENIDLLVGNSRALVGDSANYKEMIAYVTENDITDDAVYQRMCEWMDMENFMDWTIAQMWYNNTDLGNIKYWRERSEDGIWRWILYDFCWGMYNPTQDGVARLLNPNGMGAGQGIPTTLLRTLIKNPTFKQQFLERFAFHLNNTFHKDRVIAKINECADAIDDEMARDREKWPPGTRDSWRNVQVQKMIDFVEVRTPYILYFIQKNFSLSDDQMISIFGELGTAPTT